MKGNRILIVAMGRSGGYGIGNWISMELGLKFIHEPMINLLDDSGKGIVTKYLITELEAYKRNPWNGTDMESNIKGYDKRIGLIREGDRECAESQCWAERNNKWRNYYSISQEWLKENESYISEMEGWVRNKRESLLNVKGLDLIVSYEGIYHRRNDIQKVLEYLEIKEPKYLHLLNPSLRLRDTGLKPKKELI